MVSSWHKTALCDNHQQVKVRLAEIDAPEKAQPFGKRSKQSLSDLCYKKTANLEIQTRDRYGRSVATVTCNGINANVEQVKRGMAWVYDQYVRDQMYYALQTDAINSHLGLWADPNPMPPWEWRRARRK
jgi:endonuclease YncB( thermonuclease family)